MSIRPMGPSQAGLAGAYQPVDHTWTADLDVKAGQIVEHTGTLYKVDADMTLPGVFDTTGLTAVGGAGGTAGPVGWSRFTLADGVSLTAAAGDGTADFPLAVIGGNGAGPPLDEADNTRILLDPTHFYMLYAYARVTTVTDSGQVFLSVGGASLGGRPLGVIWPPGSCDVSYSTPCQGSALTVDAYADAAITGVSGVQIIVADCGALVDGGSGGGSTVSLDADGTLVVDGLTVEVATDAELATETTARIAADAAKADLVAGTVPDAQIHASIARDTEVTAAVAAEAAARATAISTAVNNLVNGAPGILDTLGEIAAQLAADESGAAALATTVAGKQPLDSDLTTIAALDSTVAGALVTDGTGWFRKTYTQLKTALGLVKADVGLANVDNTADTAKPVSTAQQTALDLKAPLASPALTGTPTAPTAAAGTSTTQLATTAFVIASVVSAALNWAAIPEAMFTGSVTRNANGAPTSATVRWPDGSTGTYTATTLSTSAPGAVDAYTVTKVTGGVTTTYTQTAVTRDATTGLVTSRPTITVA